MSRAKNLKRRCQKCGGPARRNDYVYFSNRTHEYRHASCHEPNGRKRKRRENREWWQSRHATGPVRPQGTIGADRMPNSFILAVAALQKKHKEVKKTRTRMQ